MLYGLRNTNKFSKQNTFIKCMRGKSKSRLKKKQRKKPKWFDIQRIFLLIIWEYSSISRWISHACLLYKFHIKMLKRFPMKMFLLYLLISFILSIFHAFVHFHFPSKIKKKLCKRKKEKFNSKSIAFITQRHTTH